MSRRQLLLGLLGLVTAALCGPVQAQGFPSKTITIYVPYPAGGISDIQSRTIAPHLSKALGQAVVVENLTGASGSIAAAKMLSAPADGHALMVVSPSETILAPLTVKGLKYQAEDFRLLANGIAAPTALLARASLGANNVAELLAYAGNKANKELSFGSIGPGSMPHLTAVDFQQRTGVKFLHVPYRGGAPMLNDLMGGQIDIAFMPFAGPLLGMVQSGKLKILGMATSARLPDLKQYATLNETPALKGFNYPVWSTFAVSKATPDEVVTKYNKVLNEIMQKPEIQTWVKSVGSFVPETLDVAGTAAFFQSETSKIRGLAKAVNLQAE